VEIDIYRDASATEVFLEERLQEVVWRAREAPSGLGRQGGSQIGRPNVGLPTIETKVNMTS